MSGPPHRKPCKDAEPALRFGEEFQAPQPLAGRTWTDDDGVMWGRRGQGLLMPKEARKLLALSDVRVMHLYFGAVHAHEGADRVGLVDEIEEYWAGRAHPMASF